MKITEQTNPTYIIEVTNEELKIIVSFMEKGLVAERIPWSTTIVGNNVAAILTTLYSRGK